MEKKLIAILLIICFLFSLSLVFVKQYASADALTASIIGGAAFGIMRDAGIAFTAGNANASSMSNWITPKIESYVNSKGGTLLSVFGSEIAVDIAGKMVVGQKAFNAIGEFIEWLSDAYDLSSVDFSLSDGFYNDTPIGSDITGESSTTIPDSGIGVIFRFWWDGVQYDGYENYQVYNGGVGYGWKGNSSLYLCTGNYSLRIDGSTLYVDVERIQGYTGAIDYYSNAVATISSSDIIGSLSWNGANYVAPTVLNPTQEWIGDFGAAPDTNLEDLVDDIFEGIADNNLIVEGEIIDIPAPGPTPGPAPTPVVDIIDGINTQIGQLDGIGNDIGDISGHLDDLGELSQDAVDALEGIQEGIDTQTGILGGINTKAGSIDQTLTGTQDVVNDISDTLTDALDVPSAQESTNYKFDLSTLFPFCIPFDIARMLRAFDGVAAAPHFRIPINITSIGFSYTMDLDFAMFDTLAALLRQVEFVAFAIVLAFATSKVIRW